MQGNNFIRKLLPIIIVFLLISGLATYIALRNLGLEKTFAGEDYGVWYDFPQRALNLVFFTWDSFSAPGKINVTSMIGFLWTNSMYLLYAIGLSSILSERIVYILFFVVSAFSMFIFVITIQKVYFRSLSVGATYAGALAASLLYIFNHFVLQLSSIPISPYHLSYMFLPLVFALFAYNLQIRTRIAGIYTFVLVWVIVLNGNPSNFLAIFGLLAFYFLFFYREIRQSDTKPWYFIGVSFVCTLLLTAYVYLPIMTVKSNPYGTIDYVKDLLVSVTFNSKYTSFANLFLLAGVVSWGNFTYYATYISNWIFLLLGYALAVLPLSAILLPAGRKIKIFFAVVVVITLFFGKGVYPPFENLFLYVFAHVPLFGMFRAVYSKFIYFTTFSYAVLLATVVFWGYEKLQKNKERQFIFLSLLYFAIMAYAYPFFTGQSIQYSSGDLLTQIPKPYMEVGEYTTADVSDFKILAMPPAPKGSGLILQWEGNNKYIGLHPDFIFLNRPVLDSYWFIRKEFYGLTDADSWTGTRFEEQFLQIIKYINIHNIRYIFLHKDFVEHYAFGGNSFGSIIEGKKKYEYTKKLLDTLPDIEAVDDSVFFTLYRLGDRYFYPRLYVPDTTIYADAGQDLLADIFSFRDGGEPVGVNIFRTQDDKEKQISEQMITTLPSEVFLEGQLRELVNKEELMVSQLVSSLPTPFVSWKPGSLLYPLIIMKDVFTLQRSKKDKGAYFENLLFFASKRLQEVVLSDPGNQGKARFSLSLYKSYLDEAMNLAFSAGSSQNNKEKAFISKLEAILPYYSQIIYRSRLTQTDKNQLLDDLNKRTAEVRKNKKIPDLNKFTYDVNVPVDADYEVYMSGDRKNWQLLGRERLKQGRREFVFKKEDVDSLLQVGDEGHPLGSLFHISFDYEFSNPETSSRFFLRDDKQDLLMALFDVADTGGEYKHYETYFSSFSRVYSPAIHANAKQIRNIKIERIFEPKLLLKRVGNVRPNNYEAPKIIFRKISPIKYKIQISGATKPFLLVFSEGYDKNWKAFIGNSESYKPENKDTQAAYFDGQVVEAKHEHIFINRAMFETWGLSTVPDEQHTMINGYANGWYITPNDANGQTEYEIILEFLPQRWFYAGLVVSGLTYGYIFFVFLRELIMYGAKKITKKN